jgi:hypothetical protein
MGGHSDHSDHSSHTNHNSHTNHSQHSVHSDTYDDTCSNVGTTFTELSDPITSDTFWNDLKEKINHVRNSWSMSNSDDYTPTSDSEVLASEWNSHIRDRLEEDPLDKFGDTTPTAQATVSLLSKLSDFGYPAGIDYAESKYCNTVCNTVCVSYHSDHTNHNSHNNHSDHSYHSSHSNHSSHSEHLSHSDHTAHFSHADHSSHSDHSYHHSHYASHQ